MAIRNTGSLGLTMDDRTEHYNVERVNANMQRIQDIIGDISNIDALNDGVISIESYFNQLIEKINTIKINTDDLELVDTKVKVTSWSNKMLNVVLDEINNKIGGLENLSTTDKSNLICAINELKAKDAEILNSIGKIETKTTSLTEQNANLREAVQLNRTDINSLKEEVLGQDAAITSNNTRFAQLLGIDISTL